MPIIDDNDISDLLQRTLNNVDERLVDHGKRVAFVVAKMLETQDKYTRKEQQQICFLSLLHDIGAYKTEEIDQMLQFETENIWGHSVYGYLFMKYLSPLAEYASAILYHHLNYSQLRTMDVPCKEIAQILHLADRVDICKKNYGDQFSALTDYLEESREIRFSSETIELFFKANEEHCIWDRINDEIVFRDIIGEIAFSRPEVRMYLDMLIYTIDFRSHHTVTHTITTTQIACQLAQLKRISLDMLRKIYYGSMLHDLGKVGIPVEILEFPGKLSIQAMRIMRTHVDITAEILGDSFDPVITRIALRHHEKLDGTGYQWELKADELTVPERIVAVADIVSALQGTRSYKDAFPKEKIIAIIKKQAKQGLIDGEIVNLMVQHFDAVMETVETRCKPVWEIYNKIQSEYAQMMLEFTQNPMEPEAMTDLLDGRQTQ